MSIPYIGFGSDTLESCPRVQPGDTITCPVCSSPHTLEGPDGGGDALLFYRCKGKTCIGGVGGRLTIGVKPDCSGRLDPEDLDERT